MVSLPHQGQADCRDHKRQTKMRELGKRFANQEGVSQIRGDPAIRPFCFGNPSGINLEVLPEILCLSCH